MSTRITGLHVVGVPVRDQPRALDFYVGTLGLEKRLDGPFGEGRWIEVAPRGAVTGVALVLAGDDTAVGVDTGIRLTTTDAEADHASLVAAGADVDPEVMRMGEGVPPMFTLRDPDGNQLFVVQSSRS